MRTATARGNPAKQVGIIFLLSVLLLRAAFAQGYNEIEVKAAFLYHFTSYIEWPPKAFDSPTAPVVIGVLGRSAILDALREAVRGKSAQGRAIVVRQVQTAQEMRQCHILFIPASESRSLPRVLEELDSAPVLVVGEAEGFAQRGGMVNFFLEQSKVRFEVNPDAAKRASLNISSKLLRLARVVKSL
ncbi:MAG: YfiR family protein [Armatimonadota bacterium]|nr:YfiR family protein [Armatimonadota bacterium]